MNIFDACHNSHMKYYREPFGAVPSGQKVYLRIKITSDLPVERCLLCFRENEGPTQYLPMHIDSPKKQDQAESTSQQVDSPGKITHYFGIEYECLTVGLVWYQFQIIIGNVSCFYGNNKQGLGGEGTLWEHKGFDYQISVFKPTSIAPWFKNGIMYQIYVDRFNKSGSSPEALNGKPKSLMHLHWEDTPFYIKDERGRVERWTFFGGNLQGVKNKLAYLEELGITVIYFNPIFEAVSNHKYDTGNYLKIDPMYGSNDEFEEFVQSAATYGISIILDGVFSHTGCDSIYFNKYGNYPEVGAYQSKDSPYYSWYRFNGESEEYECWWGTDSLPNVNEMDPTFKQYILGGDNSVIGYWMQKGVRGWRLDVADELPDEFIKELRLAVKAQSEQAILIGEVWEDASHKISYGVRREYFCGDELDSVMNYPLREIFINYMTGRISAEEAYLRIMSLYENYPSENFRALMNLLGSHDRKRILTILGDAPAEEGLTALERENYRLSLEARSLAVRRFKLLVLMQMTFPGVPCVYYGDEAGLEGYSDPFNRGTFPWGSEDRDLQEWHKRMIRLRKEYELFINGYFSPFYLDSDILGFRVRGNDEELVICINPSIQEQAVVLLPLHNHYDLGLDLINSEKVTIESSIDEDSSYANLVLTPLEGKVLYFRRALKEFPLQPGLDRSSGILLHITSLPSDWGIGDIGQPAEDFIDLMASCGQRLWQIMPLNPTGAGNSPYQSPSVFAGNSLLISIEKLHDEGLLKSCEVSDHLSGLSSVLHDPEKVDYSIVADMKKQLLAIAFQRFKVWLDGLHKYETETDKFNNYLSRKSYDEFLSENQSWLDDYCLFMVLKDRNQDLPWQEWDSEAASRNPRFMERTRTECALDIDYHRFVQYTFYYQWQVLRKYANSRGIRIIGDLPIYASADSCDVWSNRDLFKLTPDGQPLAFAGVPPDYFSQTGQHWGNPLYSWTTMESEGFAWWKCRIKQCLQNFDYIRLDHFRGFEAYWAIPADESTALKGRWLKGPGKRFFESLEGEFGALPFIAEDLGYLTAEVHNLKTICGFPGMKVYQFETDIAENIDAHTVLYSGTHDNDTLIGWYQNQHDTSVPLTDEPAEQFRDRIIADLFSSKAMWVIIPMQDILALGSDSRMNIPGTAEGNWQWRMKMGGITEDTQQMLRNLTAEANRS